MQRHAALFLMEASDHLAWESRIFNDLQSPAEFAPLHLPYPFVE